MFNNQNKGFNFSLTSTTTSAPTFGTAPSFPTMGTNTFGNVFVGQTNTVASSPQQQTSLFGQPQQQNPTVGYNFNASNTSISTLGTSSFLQSKPTMTTQPNFLFGNTSTSTTTQSGFNFGMQQQQSSILSPTTQTNQPSLFGQAKTTASFWSSGQSLFNTKPATTSTLTGFSGFNTTNFALNPSTTTITTVATTTITTLAPVSTQQSSIFGSLSTNSFGSFTTNNVNSMTSGVLGTTNTTTIINTFGSTKPATTNSIISSAQTSTFGSLSMSTPITTTSVINFNTTTNASVVTSTVTDLKKVQNFGTLSFGQTSVQFGASTTTSTNTTAALSSAPTSQTTTTITSLPSQINFGSNIQTNTGTVTVTTAVTTAPIKTTFGIPSTTLQVPSTSSTSLVSTATTSIQQSTTSQISTLSSTSKPNSGFFVTSLDNTTTTTTTAVSNTLSSNITTTSGTGGAVSQITFGQLEDQINIWMNELSQFEADFHSQSQTINSWDSLLISNGQKLIEMNQIVDKLKITHRGLDHQLDFIIAQQKELEQLLEQVEDNKFDLGANVNAEREHTYSLVETVHNDLKAIGCDLKDFIKKLNETKSNHDSNDPMIQILKILNQHMDVLQWMENQIKNIKIN